MTFGFLKYFMSLYKQKDSNVYRTWFLMTLFFIFVIGIGWAFSWYMQSPIILYVAVGIAILMNIFSYWYSHKLVIKMAGAKPAPDEGKYKELHNIVENIAITAGLPKPKVYILEEQGANAFATGRNPEHAVVAVTTGLLDMLERSELEGVIAHEMSHIKNYDMLLGTIAVVLAGFIAILSDIFLRMSIFGIGGRDDNGPGGWLMLVGILLSILAPIAAKLIQLAVSRKREFLADSSGALLTRYPEGLASALEKISGKSDVKKAGYATSHLFIANPFKGEKKSIAKYFMSHPPAEERIKALRSS